MTRTYVIRPDKAARALAALNNWTLLAAQSAVIAGGASPRAVLAELRAVIARLRGAGWGERTRQQVVESATLHERH